MPLSIRNRCSRWLTAVLVCLALISGVRSRATAHELAIDQVSLWPDPAGQQLRGQVSFDPELTRDLDAPLDRERAGRLAVAFLQQNLVVLLNGRACNTSYRVRELYTRGGAAPGDIVMLSCPLPRRIDHLAVRVGPAFDTAVVTIAGFGRDPAPESALVRGGATSPRYFPQQPSSPEWRAGGPEQFTAPPAASTAPASTAPASTAPASTAPASTAPASTASTAPAASETVGPAAASSTSTHDSASGFEVERPHTLAMRYVAVGFHHILPLGWDHVFFVLALALGRSRQLRRLLLELTCFTLAHTLTLGLGALGLSVIPPQVVEPLIALSIVCMGASNLAAMPPGSPRLALIFVFGLVHGQGFAGALLGTVLATDTLLAALLGFNLGVELGQAVVVMVLWALLRLVPMRFARAYVVIPLSLACIAVGSYFALERTLG